MTVRSILEEYLDQRTGQESTGGGRIATLEAENAALERRLDELTAEIADLREWVEAVAGDLIDHTT